MIAVNNESGCWPTHDQELLLRAALLQGEPALEFWNEWRRKVDLDVIDYGSHRMIPQLYRNINKKRNRCIDKKYGSACKIDKRVAAKNDTC